MDCLYQRFPHLSKSILKNLDNQSLLKSKEASREIFQFLENEAHITQYRVIIRYWYSFRIKFSVSDHCVYVFFMEQGRQDVDLAKKTLLNFFFKTLLNP